MKIAKENWQKICNGMFEQICNEEYVRQTTECGREPREARIIAREYARKCACDAIDDGLKLFRAYQGMVKRGRTGD